MDYLATPSPQGGMTRLPSAIRVSLFASWLTCLATLLLATAGCGQTSGPDLDDSAQSFIAAQQALADGDTDKAKQLLTASIQARPDAWAYYQRAKLYSDTGDDAAAQADCQAGLELDAQNTNLMWLAGELEKPQPQRFRGKFSKPPSDSK